MSIRVAMADDHPMVLKGLKNMLSDFPHIILTGSYLNGKELLNGLEQDTPDVLLLDIQLPDKTGDKLAPIILKKHPDIRILALTNFDSAFYVHSMLRIGVLGYLLKNTTDEVLIKAIETVYEGQEFLEPSMKEKVLHLNRKEKHEMHSRVTLTLREKQILQLIVNGCTTEDIAEKLFLGFSTVRNYRVRIFAKLDAKNMAELITKALTLGLAEYQ